MTYDLVYTRRAEKDIVKLDPAVRERIGRALLRFRQSPSPMPKLSPIQVWAATVFGSVIIASCSILKGLISWSCELDIGGKSIGRSNWPSRKIETEWFQLTR